MPSLNIRKIDDDVFERLRKRAERHGVSVEEEVRLLIERAVFTPDRLGQLALDCFATVDATELDLPTHQHHEPIDLNG